MGYRSRALSLLAAGVMLALASAEAQQAGKVYRIGLFHVGLDHVPPSLQPLKDGLKALGYEEGKNLVLDWRNLPDEEAARVTAKEFVRNRVDLIVAFENHTVRAAKAATTVIPVVFLHTTDPVAEGFVKSRARPGGNLTGFTGLANNPGKRLEIFKLLVPDLRRVLALTDPDDPDSDWLTREARTAATALKLRLVERNVRSAAELETLFGALKPGEIQAVFPISPNLFVKFSSLMIRLAAKKGLPVAAHRKEWVQNGALFSYAADLAEIGGRAAPYVDRILKGAKPADLPIQEPSKFELVVSLKTARSLKLAIPSTALARADQVID